MTGQKTLEQVRAELEAALGTGPAGGGEVAESLRRFLAGAGGASDPVPRQAGIGGGTGGDEIPSAPTGESVR